MIALASENLKTAGVPRSDESATRSASKCIVHVVLLFYPSTHEGFGLAEVEAASVGLPVLGLAGTVSEELFPVGPGAIIAKDLSRRSISENASLC
jgi:hypothetical protein